jgi:hypothetical protein
MRSLRRVSHPMVACEGNSNPPASRRGESSKEAKSSANLWQTLADVWAKRGGEMNDLGEMSATSPLGEMKIYNPIIIKVLTRQRLPMSANVCQHKNRFHVS